MCFTVSKARERSWNKNKKKIVEREGYIKETVIKRRMKHCDLSK